MEIIVLPPITLIGRNADPVAQAYAAGRAAATADMQFHLNGPMMETLVDQFATSVIEAARAESFSEMLSVAVSTVSRLPSMLFNWTVLGFLHGIHVTNRIADARVSAILNLGRVPSPDLIPELPLPDQRFGPPPEQVMFASAGLSGATITESDVQTFGKSSFTLINDPAFAFNGGAPTSGPTITINGITHSTYSYGIPGANSTAAAGRWSGNALNDFAPPQEPQPPDPSQGPTEF